MTNCKVGDLAICRDDGALVEVKSWFGAAYEYTDLWHVLLLSGTPASRDGYYGGTLYKEGDRLPPGTTALVPDHELTPLPGDLTDIEEHTEAPTHHTKEVSLT